MVQSIIVIMNFAITELFLSGQITSNNISLVLSFAAECPGFTLVGDTEGGPPEIYTWTRDGQKVSNGGSFRISIAVKQMLDDYPDNLTMETIQAYQQASYRSTLEVADALPGVYEYTVSNRAMAPYSLTDRLIVKGIII